MERGKKCRKTKSGVSCVDGANAPQEICDLFMKKYQDLYNSVSFSENKMDAINDNIARIFATGVVKVSAITHTL